MNGLFDEAVARLYSVADAVGSFCHQRFDSFELDFSCRNRNFVPTVGGRLTDHKIILILSVAAKRE